MGKALPTSAAELHSVGVVRAVGADGKIDQGWVRCELRHGSVPVEHCARCARKVSLRHDAHGLISEVTCRIPSERSGEQHIEGSSAFHLPRLCIGDIMTRNVLCVRPDLSLDAVTELFIESGLKAAPVVDERGALLGIVSETEVLLDVYARNDGVNVAAQPDRKGSEPPPAARTVADVMVPFAFTLPEDAPITRAAAMMAFEGTYRVTVVSEGGSVVGIVSAADVLYWVAKADGYTLPPPKRF